MTSRTCNFADPAVRLEGVYKAYRRGATSATVLTGVELAIQRGECAYLAGPSGSGKSTLLSILGCILSADRGEVCILGQDLAMLTAAERVILRRDHLGFVFQRFYLIRGLTALENVCVPLTLCGTPQGKARRRAMELLDAVGLASQVHAHPGNLSAGQCQRVALARALANSPELILADEPTASLDAQNGQEVMQLLRRLTTEEGKTAIVVTHDQRIFHFADRVFWLENGRLTQRGESANPLSLREKVVEPVSPLSLRERARVRVTDGDPACGMFVTYAASPPLLGPFPEGVEINGSASILPVLTQPLPGRGDADLALLPAFSQTAIDA